MISKKEEIYLEDVALQAMPILMDILRPKEFSEVTMDIYATDVAVNAHLVALEMLQYRNTMMANLPIVLEKIDNVVEEVGNAGE